MCDPMTAERDPLHKSLLEVPTSDLTTIQKRMLFLCRSAEGLNPSVADVGRWADIAGRTADIDDSKVRIAHSNVLQAQRLLLEAARALERLPAGLGHKRRKQARKGTLAVGGNCRVRETSRPEWRPMLTEEQMLRLRIEEMKGNQIRVVCGSKELWIPKAELEAVR